MIVIAPYAKQLLSGKRNPKNYPFWDALIPLLPRPIVQVGIDGEKQLVQDFRKNLPVQVLRNLIGMCDT